MTEVTQTTVEGWERWVCGVLTTPVKTLLKPVVTLPTPHEATTKTTTTKTTKTTTTTTTTTSKNDQRFVPNDNSRQICGKPPRATVSPSDTVPDTLHSSILQGCPLRSFILQGYTAPQLRSATLRSGGAISTAPRSIQSHP